MSINLLVIYEIADKASRVKTKKAYREFEKWIKNVIHTYHDAAIEQVAKIHLFQLKEQFSYYTIEIKWSAQICNTNRDFRVVLAVARSLRGGIDAYHWPADRKAVVR